MAWLYKQPGSRFWWIGWRVNGRQFRKSTGELDKAKAEAALAQHDYLSKITKEGKLTEAVIESLTGKPLSQVTFKAAASDWLSECQGSTAAGTAERYRAVSEELAAYIKATAAKPLLREVGSEEIRGFLTGKRATASAATVNLYRKILSTFFLRAIRNGQLKDNPMLPIKPFKGSRAEKSGRRALTLPEIKLLHDKAPSDFWRYMVMAGYTTGLRLGDLATLRWGAVDFESNAIRLTTIKTSRVMHIPMAAPLSAFLAAHRKRAKSVKADAFLWPDQAALYLRHGAKVLSNEFYSELLVPTGLAAVRTHKAAKSGRSAARQIGGVSFHSLRHSFVSTLKLTGASQSIAKELAGHSSDAVSDLYTHTPHQVLAESINKLPWG